MIKTVACLLIDALPVTAVGIMDPKEEVCISEEATQVEEGSGKSFGHLFFFSSFQ